MQQNNTTQICSKLHQKLTELSMEQSGCTIYRVHKHLRSINDKAYEPEIISIGPYHRGKDSLKMMEDHKLRYLHSLLSRKNQNLERFVSVIEPLEAKARKCYAELINLESAEFIEMLILDGCFIIDLVRKCSMPYLREKEDPIFQMDWIMNSLQRDLMLFENQIPFFVLYNLFDLIEVKDAHSRLIFLIIHFFHILYPGQVSKVSIEGNSHIKHLLHLIHDNWSPSLSSKSSAVEKDVRKQWRFIYSANGLREANVMFKKEEVPNVKEEVPNVKVEVPNMKVEIPNDQSEKTKGVSLFDIRFERGSIFLYPLTIEDRTESFLRNLIAYEQYSQGTAFVLHYVKFLDCLINTSKDVEILCRNGIINNWLGDDEVVANMVNKLTDSVAGPGEDFIYAEVFDDVNSHCGKRRNKWMAKLRRNYLNSPWAIISIIVAVVLLLLTVAQTVFSAVQVV